MSHILEVPDKVYAEMQEAAKARGLTPLDWIVAQLLSSSRANGAPIGTRPATMAERLAGRVGRISSGTGEPSSDTIAQHVAEHLEEKQRQGRL